MIDLVTGLVNSTLGYLVIAALSSLTIFIVLRRKDEFGREAVANMATSVLVAVANMGAGLLFARALRDHVQGAYDALHIPTLDPVIWTVIPVWIGAVIAVVAQDFVDYWNHRLMHSTRWGWLTHAAHHSDTHVNAFTSFRIHILESIVMWTSYTLLLTWMQLPGLVPFMIILVQLHNMYVHLNLNIDHGRFKYLLASPVFHRWHHADAPEAYGKNLANVIPLYDVMFGTYYMPGRCKAAMGAVSAEIGGTNPVAIYLYPATQTWGAIRLWVAARRAKSAPHYGSVEPRESAV